MLVYVGGRFKCIGIWFLVLCCLKFVLYCIGTNLFRRLGLKNCRIAVPVIYGTTEPIFKNLENVDVMWLLVFLVCHCNYTVSVHSVCVCSIISCSVLRFYHHIISSGFAKAPPPHIRSSEAPYRVVQYRLNSRPTTNRRYS